MPFIVKIALFNEILSRGAGDAALFIAIPMMARAGMNVFFATTRTAKAKGLAYFFKEKMKTEIVCGLSIATGVAVLILLVVMFGSIILPGILFTVLAMIILLFRSWSLKHFGGVTGDLSGAFIEGAEAVLWLAVLLCL